MSYRTIILPFTVYDKEASLLLCTAFLWRTGVAHVLNLVKKLREQELKTPLKKFKAKYYKEAHKIIPNKYYAESCCELVYEIRKSYLSLKEYWRKKLRRELPVKLEDIKLSDWIMFESRGDKYAKGNPNIRLLDMEHVRVKVFDMDRRDYFIELWVGKPKSRRYRYILEELIELANHTQVGYNARVYIRNTSEDVVKGEVQVAVPYNIYAKYYSKLFNKGYESKYVLGFDANYDRINAVLIDFSGKIKYMEKLDLTKYVTQGRKWKDAKMYTIQWLHKLLSYIALRYGEFRVAVENPEILGLLKLRWIILGRRISSDYNYRITRFTSSLTETILDTAQKLGIKTVTVNPKGTSSSNEHKYLMRKRGLDKHMTSAYLVAIRGLNQIIHEKHIKTYTII